MSVGAILTSVKILISIREALESVDNKESEHRSKTKMQIRKLKLLKTFK